MVEISCHGSIYIQKRIIEILVELGVSLAAPGEFTQRAFLNGKLDLMQVEAVADLIDSQSEASHKLAMNNLRGGVSKTIQELRNQLVDLSALIELELDFSEEDLEFADRSQLRNLLQEIQIEVAELLNSFQLGNAIKNGIPVAIIGKPNVGKSTLLNTLLNDDKALVSDIPGTTRDSIEDVMTINGIQFRFIDTAGIRQSDDVVESMGIERTYKIIEKAEIILYLTDAQDDSKEYAALKLQFPHKKWFYIINKCDTEADFDSNQLQISAKYHKNIDELKNILFNQTDIQFATDKTIISNVRHYNALQKIKIALEQLQTGMDAYLSNDLLALDLKTAINYLGELLGDAISADEVLGAIFGRFCIGK
jgi:tRNA modification GTPase